MTLVQPALSQKHDAGILLGQLAVTDKYMLRFFFFLSCIAQCSVLTNAQAQYAQGSNLQCCMVLTILVEACICNHNGVM